jgi:hypothetical protein
MPRRKGLGEVAFGWLDLQAQPLTGVAGALEESLIPGTTVTRYNRTWHMGQVGRSDASPGVILGRMGFESSESLNTVWDDERKDFVRSHPRIGQTSQFAIDEATLHVAFQIRGQVIRPWTFTTNFIALLREASHYNWTCNLEGVSQPPWDDWKSQVLRLTELDVKMKFPNPRFNDRRIDELFTETKAAAVELALKNDDGIDIDSYDFIAHAIEHASNYGTYRAVGLIEEAGEQHKETWKLSNERDAKKVEIPQDPATGEIEPENLITALAANPRESNVQPG